MFIFLQVKVTGSQCMKSMPRTIIKQGLTTAAITAAENCTLMWASMQENLSSVFANNKGADQLAHPCSPINAFFIHLLESIILKFAKG